MPAHANTPTHPARGTRTLVQIFALPLHVVVVWLPPVELLVHVSVIHPDAQVGVPGGARLGYTADVLANCCIGDVTAFLVDGSAHTCGCAHACDLERVRSGAIAATGRVRRSSQDSGMPRRAHDILLLCCPHFAARAALQRVASSVFCHAGLDVF